jgi:hypothetical protein
MFAVFHLNDMVERIGRKIMVGDVMELPNLKDYYPLDDTVPAALKRYYVVNDATRAAEGFSQTWYPHLWRVKLQPLVDSQEYKDLLNNLKVDTNGDGVDDTSLTDLLSTYDKYININDAVVDRAEEDVPASGYDTGAIYTLPVDANVKPNISITSSEKVQGYLTSDGLPPNGDSVAAGIAFPNSPVIGNFFLRLDYLPNRLFRFDGARWLKVEDAVRTNLTPGSTNTSLRSRFINDTDKFMSNAIVWDGIRVASSYTPLANSATRSFTLGNVATANVSTVVTKTPYVSTYGVRTKVNSTIINNVVGNTMGNVSFTISTVMAVGDLLEYGIYKNVINQRQSLSQALRPTADNI